MAVIQGTNFYPRFYINIHVYYVCTYIYVYIYWCVCVSGVCVYKWSAGAVCFESSS